MMKRSRSPQLTVSLRPRSNVALCSVTSCTIQVSLASSTRHCSICVGWNQFHSIWKIAQAALSACTIRYHQLLSVCLRSVSTGVPQSNLCKTQSHSSKIKLVNCRPKFRVNSWVKIKCHQWTSCRGSRSSQECSTKRIGRRQARSKRVIR